VHLRPVALAILAISLTPLVLLITQTGSWRYYFPVAVVTLVYGLVLGLLCARQPLDKTNPLFWGATGMFVMYAVHPFAVVYLGLLDLPYRSLYYRSGTYDTAVGIGAAALAAMAVGYGAATTLSRSNRHPPSTSTEVPLDGTGSASPMVERVARRLAYASVVLGVLGYSLFAVTNGLDVVGSLVSGASRGNITTSSAYLYYSPALLGPAAGLLLLANHLARRPQLGPILLVLLQLVVFGGSGQRLLLLTSVVPVFLLWAHLRGVRIRLFVFIPMVLIGLVAIVVLRDAGSAAGTTFREAAKNVYENPVDNLELFATADDTEMVDGFSIELLVVPEPIHHEPFSTIVNTVAAPVPSALWPGKPATADSYLNAYLFGVQRNNAGVAYGFVGELYYDSGVIGVVTGFAAFGAFCGWLTIWRRRTRWLPTVTLYLFIVPEVVALSRGSLALIAGRAFFAVGPVILFWFMTRRLDSKAVENIVSVS
jgi:oligosaccharide repeat unit polymerase